VRAPKLPACTSGIPGGKGSSGVSRGSANEGNSPFPGLLEVRQTDGESPENPDSKASVLQDSRTIELRRELQGGELQGRAKNLKKLASKDPKKSIQEPEPEL